MTDESFVSRGISWQNTFYAKVSGFDEPDNQERGQPRGGTLWPKCIVPARESGFQPLRGLKEGGRAE